MRGLRKLFLKSIWIFLIPIFFQGCAISGIPKDGMLFRSHYIDGLIIGSVTFPNERARFNNYQFKLSNTESNLHNRYFNIAPKQLVKMKHNGELDNGLTYLFAIRVPIGTYELDQITFSAVGAYKSSSASAFTSFPFVSEKGKITYIGNININEYADSKELPIYISDKSEIDLEAFKILYPNIEWENADMYSSWEIITD